MALILGNFKLHKNLRGQLFYNRDSDANTGTDNDLGKMNNYSCWFRQWEGVQVENYDKEFEKDSFVSFVPWKFGKIYPEKEILCRNPW